MTLFLYAAADTKTISLPKTKVLLLHVLNN